MLPDLIKTKLISRISDLKILDETSLGGGDISNSHLLTTNKGEYFLKWNNAKAYPSMFEKEAIGLETLAETNTLKVPEVILFEESEELSFLVLEYLSPESKSKNFYYDFGVGLAKMHKTTEDFFGFKYDNYIGSLVQINSKKESWIDFFVTNRLEFQLKLALDDMLIDKSLISKFEKLFTKLDSLIPKEKPSLLHGDLWGGNYLASKQGAAIIDPAVYYGHREMDIAMSRLFGGFNSEFYQAYNSEFPLEKNWEERIEICNLYPLMVHVNLFGTSYLAQALKTLNRYL